MLEEYHRLKQISQAEWTGKKDISKKELFLLHGICSIQSYLF